MNKYLQDLYHIAQNPTGKEKGFLTLCQGYIELYEQVEQLETIKKLFLEQNNNLYGGIGDE